MLSHCLNCQTQLDDKRGGAKFCTQECKNKYSYRLRCGQLSGFKKDAKKEAKIEKENLLKSSLRGVIENDSHNNNDLTPDTSPPTKNTSKGIDSEFFKNLLNQDIFNVDNKLEQNSESENERNLEQTSQNQDPKTESLKSLLPEKYISQQTQKPSFSYAFKKILLDGYLQEKTKIEQEYKELENDLKYQQGRDGSGMVLAAGLGGGLLGVLGLLDTLNSVSPNGESKKSEQTQMTLIDKNGKKTALDSKTGKTKKHTLRKNDNPSFVDGLLKMGFYVGTGAVLGYVAKTFTHESLEKEKEEKIAWILNRMAEMRQRYYALLITIKSTKAELSQTPHYTVENKQILNPEYEKAMKGISLEGVKLNMEQGQTKNLKKGFRQTEPITFKSDKIIKATELGKRDFKALRFDGLWREFFGLPSINFHALIHGNSGEGKSTFCLWFARYLAENFGRVLYVSGEEGLNKTFHDKLKYCQAEVDNFYILDVRTGEEFKQEVGENEFHFIILDSLHDMDIDARKLKEIFERYKNSGFICIDQNNKKGELLGANEKKHIVDLVVNVKNYTAETTKNRFKEKGMAFKTEDFTKSTKPKNDQYWLPKKEQGGKDGYNLDTDRRGLV